MYYLLLVSVLLASLSVSCRKSREPIEIIEESLPAGPEETGNSEDAEGDSVEDSLLNDLEMSPEELDQAKEDAKEMIEEEEKKEPPKFFTFTFKHSGQCLEVANSSVNAEGNVQQGACNGGAHQKFQLVPSEIPDHYFLRNLNSSYALPFRGRTILMEPTSFSLIVLIPIFKSFCLSIKGMATTSPAINFRKKCFDNTLSNIFTPNNIIQWDCHAEDNQKLKMDEVQLPQ